MPSIHEPPSSIDYKDQGRLLEELCDRARMQERRSVASASNPVPSRTTAPTAVSASTFEGHQGRGQEPVLVHATPIPFGSNDEGYITTVNDHGMREISPSYGYPNANISPKTHAPFRRRSKFFRAMVIVFIALVFGGIGVGVTMATQKPNKDTQDNRAVTNITATNEARKVTNTTEPTVGPVVKQTEVPASQPTTHSPTTEQLLTYPPTATPTTHPTKSPMTRLPTSQPSTPSPTELPRAYSPTATPTTHFPTMSPMTQLPTSTPTFLPTTLKPTTRMPTLVPTFQPTTKTPTSRPTTASGLPGPKLCPAQDIRVIYPNGGEVWKKGVSYTIKWYANPNKFSKVRILLKGGGDSPGGLFTAAFSTDNTGEYEYVVPENYGYSTFRIIVRSLDGSTEDASDNEFFALLDTTGQLPTPTHLFPCNGAVFDHYPRVMELQWLATPGAARYRVEVEWSPGASHYSFTTETTRVMHEHPGNQPGRWRVWAVFADGTEGPKSEWWDFTF